VGLVIFMPPRRPADRQPIPEPGVMDRRRAKFGGSGKAGKAWRGGCGFSFLEERRVKTPGTGALANRKRWRGKECPFSHCLMFDFS
jgi:hypothetical protein